MRSLFASLCNYWVSYIFFMQYLRWSQDKEWETCGQSSDFGWKQIAEPVMKLYTETTDGSSIESKESALVWQYGDADPGFGSSQAKEMLDHLESVLANEPVAVKSGHFIVEVKPQVHIVHFNFIHNYTLKKKK